MVPILPGSAPSDTLTIRPPSVALVFEVLVLLVLALEPGRRAQPLLHLGRLLVATQAQRRSPPVRTDRWSASTPRATDAIADSAASPSAAVEVATSGATASV